MRHLSFAGGSGVTLTGCHTRFGMAVTRKSRCRMRSPVLLFCQYPRFIGVTCPPSAVAAFEQSYRRWSQVRLSRSSTKTRSVGFSSESQALIRAA